jgi:predicted alpha/beta superfamily hydrolase
MSTNSQQNGRHLVCTVCTAVLLGHLLTAAGLAAQSTLPGSVPLDTHTRAGTEHKVLLAVTHVRVPSKVFHTTRDIFVWLPDGAADAVTRYPVLVFPDAEETGQFRSALANIQFLIDRQLIPPLMVVGVPYLADRIHELTPPASGSTAQNFPTAGGADQTMQFIADELLPWIDAHYPTLPTRLLAGHSAGGLFALYAMVRRPDLFRVVIAMSPALFWNDDTLSADVAARLAADTVHTRTLFLTSGGLETGGLEAPIDQPTTAFAARMTALLDSLHTNRLRFERRRYPRDAHSMTPLPGLVDGLRMAFEPILVPIDSVFDQLSAHHTQDSSEIRATLRGLESQYEAGAASLGVPAPFPEAPLDVLGSYSLSAKQPDLAVNLLRENRDRYPHSSNTHESLGEALVAVGDTSGAVGELRTAVALATAELHRTRSVLTQANERGVRAAALAQLHALHGEDAGTARSECVRRAGQNGCSHLPTMAAARSLRYPGRHGSRAGRWRASACFERAGD